MTIRARLYRLYSVVAAVALVTLGFMAFSEFFLDHHETAFDPLDFWDDISIVLLWCTIPAALAGGWWVMRKTLEPIRTLTVAVERIHEHHLVATLPRTGNGDEVDRLSEVFNAMVVRLDASFHRIRQFTLYASHELKTPLTVMRCEVETALVCSELPRWVVESLQNHLGEIRRLSDIVDKLTLLTKADAGKMALIRQPIFLDKFVKDIVEDAVILASAHGLNVELGACESVNVNGDPDSLRQLLLNLIDNAIKYNQTGGNIEIYLRCKDDLAELVICNTGPGLSLDLQDRVFDRFFRGDPAHGSAGNSSGLGLSIALSIVEAHEGTISFVSENSFTTVTVKFPLLRQRSATRKLAVALVLVPVCSTVAHGVWPDTLHGMKLQWQPTVVAGLFLP